MVPLHKISTFRGTLDFFGPKMALAIARAIQRSKKVSGPSKSLDFQEPSLSMALVMDVTITINVPLFKKLRDIIFFGGENHFMSHFEGHFEGAKTFLTL